jgi:hypothetical protein
MDLNWIRNWVQSHPRIKEEERCLIVAAMGSFESLNQVKACSREQLAAIMAAACSRWQAAQGYGGRFLAELAGKHPAAQAAFRELVAFRKYDVRLQAIMHLSIKMPRQLLQELLGQAITDRSKGVRTWAAYQCDILQIREMVPEMLRQAEVEPDAAVKRDIEFHAAMTRDGYLIERKEGGGLTLHIRLRNAGWTWQDISQEDVDRGRVPGIVAKRQAE